MNIETIQHVELIRARRANPRSAKNAAVPVAARDRLRVLTGAFALCATTMFAGCATVPADVQARRERGYVYYLDGAGGGELLSNWSGGIRDGLRDGGYPGCGEMYRWQTGLGAALDQVASNNYKRAKAAELAQKILKFRQDHPDAPVDLVGFSAGTVVAVYALEALPDKPLVNNVVLLSSSLSADYDLTAALARIRQNLYVFTSNRDVILTVLLPISGPADRGADTNRVVGASGAILPAFPSTQTSSQYAKVIEVRWNPSFRNLGNRGDHLDVLNAAFVRTHVAPLLITARTGQAGGSVSRGKIRNPDYQCWAPFPVGSWAVLEGTCTRDGHTDVCRIKTTLISKTCDSAVIEHDMTINGQRPDENPCGWRSILMADADPEDHPVTNPRSKVARIRQVQATILGQPTNCDVTQITAPDDFDFWGNDIRAEVWTASTVPGCLARLDLRTMLNGQQHRFELQITDYSVRERARRSGAN